MNESGGSPPAVETKGLTKHFGSRTVVDGIDLSVPTGSTFGFLGPNGSGKTTTIRMLLGLVFASEGEITILGRPMPQMASDVLPHVGVVVEGPAFYPWLSGRENLAVLDRLSGDRSLRPTRKRRLDDALSRVGLLQAAGRPYRRYSLGMRQRLALAGALVRPRSLLVLDEPTNGLDPQGMREVRSVLAGLASEGTTVFLSSHLLSEVEQVCTHAAVMQAGRVVAQGSLDELRSAKAPRLLVQTPDVELALRTLADFPGVEECTLVPGGLSVALPFARPEEVNAGLVHAGVRVSELVTRRPSLEDTFVELTGEGFDVGG